MVSIGSAGVSLFQICRAFLIGPNVSRRGSYICFFKCSTAIGDLSDGAGVALLADRGRSARCAVAIAALDPERKAPEKSTSGLC
jgi:hypothetical protein